MELSQDYYASLARMIPARPLPIAIAHLCVTAGIGSPKQMLLTKLYQQLSSKDQLTCRAELYQCRRAIRGEILAEVR